MRVTEIGYYNTDYVWMGADSAIATYITTIPNDDTTSIRKYPIELDTDDEESKKRTIVLTAPFPKRCLESPADSPEPLFFEGDDTLAHGKPYLLFAANKIFKISEYAWYPDAFEKSKMLVTVQVLSQYNELAELPVKVANMIAGCSGQNGPRRQQIPDDVKLAVWARDGQACVACQATNDLQFDHVIPFSLGGSNTTENIQLLCRACNIKKSDKIAF